VDPEVLVIGGGIVGVTSAAYLARAGAVVVLLEHADLASGPSGRSQGLVGGPHPPPVHDLAERSLAAYLELAHKTGAFALDADDIGCLMLAEDDHELPPEAERVDAHEAEPLLATRPAAAGVIECRRIDPAAAVAAWAAEARQHGAEIRTGVPVRSLAADGDRVVGAHTDTGFVPAGTTVLATGWEAPRLLAPIGGTLDVVGVRGWIATTRPAPFRLRRPIMEMGYKQSFARLELLTVGGLARGEPPGPLTAALISQDAAGRVLLGASLAHATGAADSDGAAALRGITSRALELVPALADVAVAETRTCVRPVSADGLPYLGPLDGLDGLVVAAGHGGTGVTLGPGSGELVARGVREGAWDPRLLPGR
jgi:glycine/D-amino acid oxidase-like deaminating enzyme